jgi:hypothetical protein
MPGRRIVDDVLGQTWALYDHVPTVQSPEPCLDVSDPELRLVYVAVARVRGDHLRGNASARSLWARDNDLAILGKLLEHRQSRYQWVVTASTLMATPRTP